MKNNRHEITLSGQSGNKGDETNIKLLCYSLLTHIQNIRLLVNSSKLLTLILISYLLN